jgi:hypothetical protein
MKLQEVSFMANRKINDKVMDFFKVNEVRD